MTSVGATAAVDSVGSDSGSRGARLLPSAERVADEVDQQRRRVPADGPVIERVSGLLAGTAAEVPGGDDGDAREGRRTP